MHNLQYNRKTIILFAMFHIAMIALSNYAVQFPFELFGIHLTWGAISYPLIFVATDLIVRFFGAKPARRVVKYSLVPGILLGYIVSTMFHGGELLHITTITSFNDTAGRIVLASIAAYGSSQLLDIVAFNKLRATKQWYAAPMASSLVGTMVDTFVFFFVAFYGSSDPFMASHWPAIALSDLVIKTTIAVFMVLPMYGLLLSYIQKRIK